MPRLRPDQYLSCILFLAICLSYPFTAVAQVEIKPITQIEPLPNINHDFYYPSAKNNPLTPPLISAKAAFVYDPESGSILYEKNSEQTFPQASLTKLMTAIVAMESYSLNEIVMITHGEEKTGGNVMNLEAGESITVENLLKGLLIYSANDAAVALANHHPQGLEAFMNRMNEKARELHLQSTAFRNPAGFDEERHYSSAYDLAILSKEAMSYPELFTVMQTAQATVTSTDGQIVHSLETTNQLLNVLDGVIAGKTGSTLLAGECLVTEVRRNNHSVITVVLGSKDRFGDTQQLVDWVYNEFDWKKPI
jgi:D-alanyl-D-alanine carboxypeptidase (penicillin-binding protein 5/6)